MRHAGSLAGVIIFAGLIFAISANAVEGLPVLVRVYMDPDFRSETTVEFDYSDGRGMEWERTVDIADCEPEELEKVFTAQLLAKLASWDTSNTIEPILCKSEDELMERVRTNQAFLALRVLLTERKANKTDFYYTLSLTGNVQLHRLTGGRWEKLVDGRVKADGTRYKKGQRSENDVQRMIGLLDEMVMKSAVAFEPVSSIPRNARTRTIRLKVGNLTSYDVTMIEWSVPTGEGEFKTRSEGRLKSGSVVDVEINVVSEGSHSRIQWEDVKISQIKFAKPTD